MLTVKIAVKNNIDEIAKINLACFHGCANLKEAKKWLSCNFRAWPRFQYFILKKENKILGYILWKFLGGWRKESVLELEQIAIVPEYHGCGFASKLIKESLTQLKKYLKKENRKLKSVLVTTGTKQKARKLYEKVLKVKCTAKIKGLFDSDEIILLRRFK
jgi:ribosomal protein S18 acetylase RimI-like enzyme